MSVAIIVDTRDHPSCHVMPSTPALSTAHAQYCSHTNNVNIRLDDEIWMHLAVNSPANYGMFPAYEVVCYGNEFTAKRRKLAEKYL